MLSLRPITYRLLRTFGLNRDTLDEIAVERWEIAPAEVISVPPAIILPGQTERITRTEFASLDHVIRSLAGNPAERFGPTMAYRLRDVDVVDGALYSAGLSMYLRARKRHLPLPARPEHRVSGSLYETWNGNRWFGNWLLDDCLSYRLAEATGGPVTTMPCKGHVPRYEKLLNMTPDRIGDAHFDELIVFADYANNSHRRARAQDMRHRLLQGRTPQPNPGVFLLRSRSGDLAQRRKPRDHAGVVDQRKGREGRCALRLQMLAQALADGACVDEVRAPDLRVLENEQEIAERLAHERGFRVMFPEDHSVDELMDACGGARVIAGIEGSQLNHGIAVMPPGGTLFTIQPANRATTAMKLLSDRWQQRFAMVVGHGVAESFRVEWDDIARTLDRIESEAA